jgi:hypothetical protein
MWVALGPFAAKMGRVVRLTSIVRQQASFHLFPTKRNWQFSQLRLKVPPFSLCALAAEPNKVRPHHITRGQHAKDADLVQYS